MSNKHNVRQSIGIGLIVFGTLMTAVSILNEITIAMGFYVSEDNINYYKMTGVWALGISLLILMFGVGLLVKKSR